MRCWCSFGIVSPGNTPGEEKSHSPVKVPSFLLQCRDLGMCPGHTGLRGAAEPTAALWTLDSPWAVPVPPAALQEPCSARGVLTSAGEAPRVFCQTGEFPELLSYISPAEDKQQTWMELGPTKNPMARK